MAAASATLTELQKTGNLEKLLKSRQAVILLFVEIQFTSLNTPKLSLVEKVLKTLSSYVGDEKVAIRVVHRDSGDAAELTKRCKATVDDLAAGEFKIVVFDQKTRRDESTSSTGFFRHVSALQMQNYQDKRVESQLIKLGMEYFAGILANISTGWYEMPRVTGSVQ